MKRGFFSRFFTDDHLEAGVSIPSTLSGPPTESGLDAATMEGILADIDLDTAIASHDNWKLRLQNFLDGNSSEILKPEILCMDNRCDLGQWLHGSGKQRLGHYPAFQILISRHKNFHVQASTVVALAQSGNTEKARHAMDAPYRHASSQVVLLLRQLKRGLQY